MTPEQLSLCAAFTAAKVDYAVVGGVAVNAYGYVRATQDLDLFLRPTQENARAAFEVLLSEGVDLGEMEPDDLLNDEEHLRFGAPREKVDVLSSIGEMPFEQVWRNRVEAEVRGVLIPFIGKEDLILNKQQTGRLRDLNDVDELLAIRSKDVDPSMCSTAQPSYHNVS